VYGDPPCAGSARHEHDDYQGDAGIAVRVSLDAQDRAEYADQEDSYAEHPQALLEVRASYRADQCAEGRSGETLCGDRQGGAERGLHHHHRRDGRPVSFRQAE